MEARGARTVTLATAMAASLTASQVRADDFSGTWRAGPLQVRIQVQSWGGDCGPRPPARSTEPGGTVEITQSGDHLRFGGAVSGRTDRCWTRNRAAKRVATRYQSQTWRTVCRTGEDDPRAEVGNYTLRASGRDRLVFEERSEYDWELNRSRCVAERTASRTFERIDATGSDDPQRGEQKPEEPAPSCDPGAPKRLQLRPERADIEPGERMCIRGRVLDAKGCPLTNRRIRYALPDPPAPGGTLKGRCFEASTNTAESEGTYRIVARSGGLRAEAVLTVRAPDLSDLIARGMPEGKPSGSDSEPGLEPESEAGARVAARTRDEDAGGSVLLRSTLTVGAVLLLVLTIGVVLARRRRPASGGGDPAGGGRSESAAPEPAERASGEGGAPVASAKPEGPPVLVCAVCAREFHDDTMFCPVDGARLVDPASAGTRTNQGMICPSCRRGYPPDARFCPHDSEELMPYAMFAARRAGGEPTSGGASKICPHCGDRYELDVRFCGKDGTELVLVN